MGPIPGRGLRGGHALCCGLGTVPLILQYAGKTGLSIRSTNDNLLPPRHRNPSRYVVWVWCMGEGPLFNLNKDTINYSLVLLVFLD